MAVLNFFSLLPAYPGVEGAGNVDNKAGLNFRRTDRLAGCWIDSSK